MIFFFGDSYESLVSLASKLLHIKEVSEKAKQLEEEHLAVLRGWQQKDDFLRQTLDLQLFNREADQIDAATSSQQAFLEFHDLGVRPFFLASFLISSCNRFQFRTSTCHL